MYAGYAEGAAYASYWYLCQQASGKACRRKRDASCSTRGRVAHIGGSSGTSSTGAFAKKHNTKQKLSALRRDIVQSCWDSAVDSEFSVEEL